MIARVWLPLGLALCVAPAAEARRGPPAACGTVAVTVERAETLESQGALGEALQATARIPIDDLPADCRVYVRGLRAKLFIALDRHDEARALYGVMLDEVPSWRPNPDASGPEVRRVFREARAAWVASNAGPLRITPNAVSLLSPAPDVDSSTQPLLIQAMQQGEISWRVRPEASWIRLSRTAGTTLGGRDTIVVAAGAIAEAPADTTLAGRIVFHAPPWPEVPVDVSWQVLAPVVRAEAAGTTRRRRIAWVGVGALLVVGIVGAIAY